MRPDRPETRATTLFPPRSLLPCAPAPPGPLAMEESNEAQARALAKDSVDGSAPRLSICMGAVNPKASSGSTEVNQGKLDCLPQHGTLVRL